MLGLAYTPTSTACKAYTLPTAESTLRKEAHESRNMGVRDVLKSADQLIRTAWRRVRVRQGRWAKLNMLDTDATGGACGMGGAEGGSTYALPVAAEPGAEWYEGRAGRRGGARAVARYTKLFFVRARACVYATPLAILHFLRLCSVAALVFIFLGHSPPANPRCFPSRWTSAAPASSTPSPSEVLPPAPLAGNQPAEIPAATPRVWRGCRGGPRCC